MMTAVLTPSYAGLKALMLLLALPPTPLLLLAAWGAWRWKRGRRAGAWALGLGLLGVWMSCTEAAGELLSRAVGAPPVFPPAQVALLRGQTDGVVLVLGGGVDRHVPEYGHGGPSRITAERLAYGVWLARRSGWPLGFTGGIGWAATDLKQPEAEVIARIAAEDYGLPLRWTESTSRDTRENAAHTLPMLASEGVRQVLLVTHHSHMRRALRAFEPEAARRGIRILPAPVGLRNDALSSLGDWCPSVEGFGRVRYVIYEQLGWWAGR